MLLIHVIQAKVGVGCGGRAYGGLVKGDVPEEAGELTDQRIQVYVIFEMRRGWRG